jgi:hypothetical protein
LTIQLSDSDLNMQHIAGASSLEGMAHSARSPFSFGVFACSCASLIASATPHQITLVMPLRPTPVLVHLLLVHIMCLMGGPAFSPILLVYRVVVWLVFWLSLGLVTLVASACQLYRYLEFNPTNCATWGDEAEPVTRECPIPPCCSFVAHARLLWSVTARYRVMHGISLVQNTPGGWEYRWCWLASLCSVSRGP